MPFDMYGEVILTRDVPKHGLRAGDVGTVVERHTVPGVGEEGYSVIGATTGLAARRVRGFARRSGLVPAQMRAWNESSRREK
jgi:hypothetical protein